ncbi:MAG: xanthine dehydrogenase family protein molybdopterin-binding subunit [Actinobacteria bacterium]|jgi:carbon-monoxide dehydrogenase large subunit|nr:xanthine dehydrogenase family protein molybdopterin-binding subunit [Actinomycetota bacterium]MBT4476614.1 xanthine dehydrogenase family protein molybdopterin-binding subunit [Actinomycetota bacterium]MBT4656978.1 xanthine dehydrogenase family protein molybdopterin-binding subunit [Actinomycetota bacterium]MBT5084454.1 xanthine dehydrogenase family protein molybdopterin-binding subunit [Actinomycetota bacterium]MBT5505270.1 xanthine dehydrogenase family protein molybdopterin-binding subunit 
MSILGNRVLRREDESFLTTGATYTADLVHPLLENAAMVTYVRSTMAHATINVDTSEALTMPGVLAVMVAADLDGPSILPGAVPMFPEPMLNRPILATDTVRFVGECVAVIVSETATQGVDAAEAVFVDYEPLPVVVDMEEALTDEVVVYAEVGTNLAIDFSAIGMATGITDETFFANCDVVTSGRVAHQRTAAAPLEVRSTAAAWDGDKLVFWTSNQVPQGVKGVLGTLYAETATGGVQVIVPDVGGGFGAKIAAYPEDVLLPWLAQKIGRPMRWFETRTENMQAMGPGRAHVHRFTLGGSADGNLTHYRLEVLVDSGAYARLGAFLPMFTLPMTTGVYEIASVETSALSVITNTTPTEAYRGAGRPEATLTIERAVELWSFQAGLDPVEVRRQNFLAADSFPVTTGVGTVYDSGEYERSLDLALEAADYPALREQQAQRRTTGEAKQLGIGIATYVEVTAGPAPGGSEYGKVEITPEGKARIYSGALSHGQSHMTTFSMIAADQLGIDMNDIEFVQGDTDVVTQGVGTFGSRSTQLGGSSIHKASGAIVERARSVAADLLEANVDDVVLDKAAGLFHVAGSPAVSRTWADIAAATDDLSEESKEDLLCSYPFGTHVAVVEVDTETGGVTLLRMITCDDAGRIINPLIVEGQRHGGIAQGVAQALYEEVVYDADGNLQTANFADYGFISAAELPSFELVPLETPTPNNPLGVKGIGESGAIGSTPAVQSAVIDALRPLGVTHIDVPLSPEKVWSALAAAQES